MSTQVVDLDKLLSIEGIECSIKRLQRVLQISVGDKADLSHDESASSVLNTAAEYKEEGNEHFGRASYIPAALSWSRGLMIEPGNVVLLLNRSLGYLKLEWYEAALRDSEAVLARCTIPAHIRKARARAAWAEYGLGLYQDALRSFQLNKDIPQSTQWIARCKQRIREQSSGSYEWAALFTGWREKYNKSSIHIPRLDIADYIGPVEVRAVAGRGGGRGVIATRDIKCGELLVMAKPFVSVYPSELPAPGRFFSQTAGTGITCKDMLAYRAAEKIIGRPECANLVMDLYAGEGFPSPPNTYPPTSTGRPLAMPLSIDDSLDLTRIKAIVRRNGFAANPLCVAQFTKAATDSTGPAALHLMPPLFNHACFANTVRYSLGDVMVMHANQDISCGTELTSPYAGGGNHLTREQSLTYHLGSQTCDCKLCDLDRADGDEAARKREELLLEHERTKESLLRRGVSQSNPVLENNYKRYIRAIDSTYALTRGPLRPSIFFLQVGLSQVYMDRAAMEQDISLYEDARHSLLASLAAVGVAKSQSQTRTASLLPIASNNLPATGAHEDAIILMVQIAITYYCEHERLKAKEWVRAAHWLHAASRGGDVAFFNARFNEFLTEISPAILSFFLSVK